MRCVRAGHVVYAHLFGIVRYVAVGETWQLSVFGYTLIAVRP